MKKLKFETLEELTTYICENELNVKDIIVCLEEDHEQINEELKLDNFDIKLLSFNDNSILFEKIGEENILFVEDFEYIENSCSTARIKLNEKIIWLNVCDAEGASKVNLDVAINEKNFYNVPFIIKKREMTNVSRFIINKDLIK